MVSHQLNKSLTLVTQNKRELSNDIVCTVEIKIPQLTCWFVYRLYLFSLNDSMIFLTGFISPTINILLSYAPVVVFINVHNICYVSSFY